MPDPVPFYPNLQPTETPQDLLDRIAELEAVLCTARDLLAGPNVMPTSEQRYVFAQNLTDVLERNPVR